MQDGNPPDETAPSPGFPGLHFPGVGSGLAFVRDGKVLLYHRRKAPEADHWNITGGKVEHMEPAAEASRREALEESGLTVRSDRFLCHSEQIIGRDRQHWLSLIFVSDHFDGKPALMEPEKFHGFGWCSPDALPAPLSRFAADAISALIGQGYLARSAAS
nr:NUDIX domain-containing protein [uncultured Gellertiella sp.]